MAIIHENRVEFFEISRHAPGMARQDGSVTRARARTVALLHGHGESRIMWPQNKKKKAVLQRRHSNCFRTYIKIGFFRAYTRAPLYIY